MDSRASGMRFSLAFEGDLPIPLYRRLLIIAEKYGFFSFQIYEHISFRPAWSILFSIANLSRRVRLGPVTVPVLLQHPIYTAAQTAALMDQAQGGVILGLSRGAFYDGLHLAGKHSILAVEDALKIVHNLLTGVDTGHNGREFSIDRGINLKWKPTGSFMTVVGTSGPKMIAMACKSPSVAGLIVDNLWNPEYARKINDIVRLDRKETATTPNDFEIIARPFCAISENESEANEIARRQLQIYLQRLVGRSPMIEAAGITPEDIEDFTAGNPIHADQKIIDNFSACGTPEMIIKQTETMLNSGATHICFGHPLGKDPLEAIELIGKKILPYFREWGI